MFNKTFEITKTKTFSSINIRKSEPINENRTSTTLTLTSKLFESIPIVEQIGNFFFNIKFSSYILLI